jgi:Fic family protein
LFTTPELTEREREVVGEIHDLRRDLNYAIGQPSRRWFGLLRRNTFARAVRGSNTIEGYNVTIDDAVAAVDGEEPINPKDESWLAVSGYRDAMTYVMQKTDDRFFGFSPELLKSLHFMMVGYDLTKNPGRWRPGPIYVRDESTGQRVYEGPPADTVPKLLDELIAELGAGQMAGGPDTVRAAMAHLNLVMIHPFSDGNGRMARCLQTLVLARSGVVAPIFSSIEEYLGRNTRAYYDVLADVGNGAWHPERDARPWIRFCLTAHYRQAVTLLRRTREIQKLCDELEIIVKRLGLPERSVLALADAAMGFRMRNQSYRSVADVSHPVAGRDLRALAKAGLLVANGERRGRYYVAAAQVLEIRKRISERKSNVDPLAMGAETFITRDTRGGDRKLPGMERNGA